MFNILTQIGPPGPLLAGWGPVLGNAWKNFTNSTQPAVTDPSLAQTAESLLPLALELAGPYDCQEAIRVALRKVLRAVVKFDPRRNVPLEVYARILIQRGLKEWHASRENRQARVFTSLTERPLSVAPPSGRRVSKRCQPGDLGGLEAELKVALLGQVRPLISSNELAAFERFHFEGQGIGMIAKSMQVTEGTVKSWLFRGRRKIRKLRDFHATLVAHQQDRSLSHEDQWDNELLED